MKIYIYKKKKNIYIYINKLINIIKKKYNKIKIIQKKSIIHLLIEIKNIRHEDKKGTSILRRLWKKYI